jgi:hypothetical protein
MSRRELPDGSVTAMALLPLGDVRVCDDSDLTGLVGERIFA